MHCVYIPKPLTHIHARPKHAYTKKIQSDVNKKNQFYDKRSNAKETVHRATNIWFLAHTSAHFVGD